MLVLCGFVVAFCGLYWLALSGGLVVVSVICCVGA